MNPAHPNTKHILLTILITMLVFVIFNNSLIGAYKFQLTILALLVLLANIYWLTKKDQSLLESRKTVYSLIIFILALVYTTGWFFSPFFFSLYLLAISLAFIFSMSVAVAFTITLAILFSFNIGQVDIAYDSLVVVSLLTVIPLSYYLQKEYAKLKSSQTESLAQPDSEYQQKAEKPKTFSKLHKLPHLTPQD